MLALGGGSGSGSMRGLKGSSFTPKKWCSSLPGQHMFLGRTRYQILKSAGDARVSWAKDVHSMVGDGNQQDAVQKTSYKHASALKNTYEGRDDALD